MNSFSKILIIWLFCCSAQCEEMVVVSSLRDSKESDAVWEWVVPKARFSAPENACDLDSGKFPVDVNQYCVIARSNIMARYKWTSAPELALVNIRQVRAQVNPNDASSPPLQRVVISFRFREPGTGSALGPVKDVAMLLDGTIATMRRRPGR